MSGTIVDEVMFLLDSFFLGAVITCVYDGFLSLRRLMIASGIRIAVGKPALAAVCTIAAGSIAALADGILFAGGCYLLLLGGMWYLCRIVGKDDLLWLRKLIGGRR